MAWLFDQLRGIVAGGLLIAGVVGVVLLLARLFKLDPEDSDRISGDW